MVDTQHHAGGGRRGQVIAFLLGPLVLALVTLTASRAAFFDTTENTGNSLAAGTVTLTDDDDGAARFAVTGMVPGDSETACIVVTYEGTVADPGPVVIYSGGFTDPASMAAEINLTIEEGTGGTFDDCTGFSGAVIESDTLALFNTNHTNYATGAGTWDPSSTPDSRTYQITVELDPNASNDVQGDSITDLVFVWEVQS